MKCQQLWRNSHELLREGGVCVVDVVSIVISA